MKETIPILMICMFRYLRDKVKKKKKYTTSKYFRKKTCMCVYK